MAQRYGIALDVAGNKMYWTNWTGTPRIQRANLDGSGVEDLVATGPHPLGIALDVAGGKIYWGDNVAQTIQRANLDGIGGGKCRHRTRCCGMDRIGLDGRKDVLDHGAGYDQTG